MLSKNKKCAIYFVYFPIPYTYIPTYTHPQALEDVPIFMRAFMGEVKDGIDDVLDVHHMVVSNLVKNKSLMNRVS